MTKNPNLELYQQSGNEETVVLSPEEAWRQNLRGDISLLDSRQDDWWTGKMPQPGVCPGVGADGVIRALALPNLKHCTRKEILDYFDNSWTLTEVLFSSLQGEEAFYRPPYHQLRHPLIFYYCHPAVLYINKLRLAGLLKQGVNPYYEQFFETGVDEMSWDDLSKNQVAFPAVREVTEYRAKVYQIVHHLIETHPDFAHLPITPKSALWALFMAFEHEHIHLETSSVLIRELPINLIKKPNEWPVYYPLVNAANANPQRKLHYPENKFIRVDIGTAQIGKPDNWPSFGWDNEYGKRDIVVKPFRATQFLISNAEFWAFVAAEGYHQQKYWSEEGWKWRSFRNAKWPTFWVPDGPAGSNQFKLRLCFDIVAMQWAWPVDVNYHEAQAYCAWRTEIEKAEIPYRLTTEAEHHRLRSPIADDPVMVLSGQDMFSAKFNFNLAFGSQTPVNYTTPSTNGFYDVFGNAWEWCEDHFAALPGFMVNDLYDDFSSPCFDGQHNIIMGGSFVSTGDLASKFARYHFRRHFFQHAGFRMVQALNKDERLQTTCLDAPPPHVGAVPCCTNHKNPQSYESTQLLNQYLLLHYGNYEATTLFSVLPKDTIAFPKRCAQLLIEMCKKYDVKMERVLDLGCAVGGASFELSHGFKQVIGVDLSSTFINAANTLKDKGTILCVRKDEGDICTNLKVNLDSTIDKKRVHFQVADATSLPSSLDNFDAVLAANLLCRLPSPKSCLQRMGGPHGLVRLGGLLLIASPYSWMESYTPKAAWLGGKIERGQQIKSIDGLHAALDGHFRLIAENNIPFVIREHARKFEYIITHVTLWQRIR